MQEDGLYADELKQLERELPSFRYIPTYSREESSNGEYRTGYVHSIYEEICGGEKRQGVDSPYPASFFLCGWKNMIDEAKQRILAMGYEKRDIHQELYG